MANEVENNAILLALGAGRLHILSEENVAHLLKKIAL